MEGLACSIIRGIIDILASRSISSTCICPVLGQGSKIGEFNCIPKKQLFTPWKETILTRTKIYEICDKISLGTF